MVGTIWDERRERREWQIVCNSRCGNSSQGTSFSSRISVRESFGSVMAKKRDTLSGWSSLPHGPFAKKHMPFKKHTIEVVRSTVPFFFTFWEGLCGHCKPVSLSLLWHVCVCVHIFSPRQTMHSSSSSFFRPDPFPFPPPVMHILNILATGLLLSIYCTISEFLLPWH